MIFITFHYGTNELKILLDQIEGFETETEIYPTKYYLSMKSGLVHQVDEDWQYLESKLRTLQEATEKAFREQAISTGVMRRFNGD